MSQSHQYRYIRHVESGYLTPYVNGQDDTSKMLVIFDALSIALFNIDTMHGAVLFYWHSACKNPILCVVLNILD